MVDGKELSLAITLVAWKWIFAELDWAVGDMQVGRFK